MGPMKRRKTLEKVRRKVPTPTVTSVLAMDVDEEWEGRERVDIEMANEEDIEGTFEMPAKRPKNNYRDTEFFMSHHQKDAATDKGYSLRDGASFAEQAAHATFDLTNDDGVAQRQRRDSQLTWDKKKKKFVKGGGEGADNIKIVTTESGARLPASYRSGRFDEWKAKNKVSLPRLGEAEPEMRVQRSGGPGAGGGPGGSAGGRRFKHNSTQAAKPLDPKKLGYERKVRLIKKKEEVAAAAAGGSGDGGPKKYSSNGRPVPVKKGKGSGKTPGKFGGANVGKVKSELKSSDQIRKSRAVEMRKKEKNARPSKKGKR